MQALPWLGMKLYYLIDILMIVLMEAARFRNILQKNIRKGLWELGLFKKTFDHGY